MALFPDTKKAWTYCQKTVGCFFLSSLVVFRSSWDTTGSIKMFKMWIFHNSLLRPLSQPGLVYITIWKLLLSIRKKPPQTIDKYIILVQTFSLVPQLELVALTQSDSAVKTEASHCAVCRGDLLSGTYALLWRRFWSPWHVRSCPALSKVSARTSRAVLVIIFCYCSKLFKIILFFVFFL